jgi:hypothetical protein
MNVMMIERRHKLIHPDLGPMVAPIRAISPSEDPEDMRIASELALESLTAGRDVPGEWVSDPVALYEIDVNESVVIELKTMIAERIGR